MATPKNLSRRYFIKSCLSATAASLTVQPSVAVEIKPVAGADMLTTYQVGPHIWIRWANQLLTSYRAHTTQKYPYFYPVAGPVSGLSLTTESSEPFPHHRSILFSCDHVNGTDYWHGHLDRGRIISKGPRIGKCTPVSTEIFDQCEWTPPHDEPTMTDRRKFTVTANNPKLRFIDAEIAWRAVTDVTITQTNHSLFALRAAPDITPWGGGTLINSEGQTGEKATFGKSAAWCAYFGRRKCSPDVVEGIAILDHPKNPWSPCFWFTRDYGFISPTPFQFLDKKKPWQLDAGCSVTLRYLVVLFAGNTEQAGLKGIWKSWSGT